MYSNIGKKIMMLTVIIACTSMAASFVYGLYLVFATDRVGLGIEIAILGPIGAWIGGFFLYGFGRLIDNTDYIARKLGRRDGFGIPDTSDKLDWSAPDDDEHEEPLPPPRFVAQRVVSEKKDGDNSER